VALPTMTISSASLEYVPVRVKVRKAGAVYDPTGDTVTMAFLQAGATPTSGDFKAATWETDTTSIPGTPIYRALCLVGPSGTTQLAAGVWTVWVKVTDSPEIPVLYSGLLKVM